METLFVICTIKHINSFFILLPNHTMTMKILVMEMKYLAMEMNYLATEIKYLATVKTKTKLIYKAWQ